MTIMNEATAFIFIFLMCVIQCNVKSAPPESVCPLRNFDTCLKLGLKTSRSLVLKKKGLNGFGHEALGLFHLPLHPVILVSG